MTENTTYGNISIIGRKSVDVTGVSSVDSFDEYAINLSVSGSTLVIEGEGLNITTLDLERGKVFAQGKINGVYYSDSGSTSSGSGIFSKLFGKNK
jgi:sporulation protein YabP